jgi:hypothetical protein
MPRSGTKLVRALLNLHSTISITLAESHFVPYLVRRYGRPPRLRDRSDLRELFAHVGTTPFAATLRRQGRWPDAARFVETTDPRSWSSILANLLRPCGPKGDRPDVIWGDKTPGYLLHLPLLRELFPEGRVLHVLRDPRDECLSVRRSFGKDPIRAAHRWRVSVERARRDAALLGDTYRELRYEELLADPQRALRETCDFVGVPWEPGMLELDSSHEDLGDARGAAGILHTNTGKWTTGLTEHEQRRIEGVLGEVAVSAGYRLVHHRGAGRPLGAAELWFRRLKDAVPTLRHHLRTDGTVWRRLARLLGHRRVSSWRGHGRG